jgi:outer membrane protein TolC
MRLDQKRVRFLSSSVAAALAATALLLGSPGAARADREPRTLSLSQAVDLALRSNPQIMSPQATAERAQLGVLRAQLDRFSLRVDTFVTEQYNAANIGGNPSSASCATALPTAALLGGNLYAPLQLLSLSGGSLGSPSQAECSAAMGVYIAPQTIQSAGLGQFSVSANLQAPVFSGFRVTANVNHAKLSRDSAEASVRQAQRGVALDLLRAYWGARRIELQQVVSEQAIARFDDAVKIVNARVRNGLAPAADLNRIESRRQTELARRADLAGSAAESRAQIAVALGLGGTPLVLTEAADLPPPPSATATDVEQLLAEARRERPDLRAARLQTAAQYENVRMALSNYYPQLGISGLLQFTNNPYNPLIGARNINSSANPFTNITGSVFFGATLSMNLFDTLNTYTSVRDARLEQKRLAAEEQRIGRVIESDVRVLHARLLHLYSMHEPLQKSRDIAADNLAILEKRYRIGDVMVLDLIDGAVELLNAEINLTNQVATIAQTWGELYLAAGRMPPPAAGQSAEYSDSGTATPRAL